MLPKKYRLEASYLQSIYKEGKKFRGKYGMLVVKTVPSIDNPKFAFVVSKKIGNSVQRHRMTRLLRNITHECILQLNLQQNIGCQYIAFKYTDDYADLKEDYEKQIREAFGFA